MTTRNPLKLPARINVVGIDDTEESLREMGARRDTLRQMAEQCTREADAIEKEINDRTEQFRRRLHVLQAELAS